MCPLNIFKVDQGFAYTIAFHEYTIVTVVYDTRAKSDILRVSDRSLKCLISFINPYIRTQTATVAVQKLS